MAQPTVLEHKFLQIKTETKFLFNTVNSGVQRQ